MSWFTAKLDARTKALVEDLAGAYADRSALTSKLILVKPSISDIEMGVLWAAGATAMHKEAFAKNEAEKTTAETACEFFDSYCQDFVTHLLQSQLILGFDSVVIREQISTVLESMEPSRLEEITSLFIALSGNALKLACSLIDLLSAGLSPVQAREARKHSIAYVNSRKDLISVEKSKAIEWVEKIKWTLRT